MWRPTAGAVVVVASLAAIVLSAARTPALASQAVQLAAPRAPDEALIRDAENYADYWGVTLQQALERLELQSTIGVLNAKLEGQMPPWFSGMWIEHKPYRVVVGYNGVAYAVVASAVLGTPLDPYLELRERSVSLAGLLSTAEEAYAALDPRESHVDIDLSNTRVLVDVLHAGNLATTLASSVDRDDLLTVREVPAFGESGLDIYGGLANADCTWGFTVFQNADPSPSGIMTAGHCQDSQTFQGINLPFVNGQGPSFDRDAQWHTTPGITDRNWVQDNANGHTRAITVRRAWANVTVGETLCKYGKNTKWTCGEVLSKTDRPPWIPNASPVWLKVGRTGVIMSAGGDSGSPLFISGVAYGINQGYYFEFFGTQDGVFGSITYQEQALQVTVKTS